MVRNKRNRLELITVQIVKFRRTIKIRKMNCACVCVCVQVKKIILKHFLSM